MVQDKSVYSFDVEDNKSFFQKMRQEIAKEYTLGYKRSLIYLQLHSGDYLKYLFLLLINGILA